MIEEYFYLLDLDMNGCIYVEFIHYDPLFSFYDFLNMSFYVNTCETFVVLSYVINNYTHIDYFHVFSFILLHPYPM